MKRFGMAVAALLMCATMSFAQKPSLSREPFVVSTEKLANYLQLTPSQLDEVANINEYFIEMQNASVKASAKLQDKKMYQAVYGNLKLMKKALSPDQYRKYVTLLNITNNNNRTLGVNTFPEVYLADNASKKFILYKSVSPTISCQKVNSGDTFF